MRWGKHSATCWTEKNLKRIKIQMDSYFIISQANKSKASSAYWRLFPRNNIYNDVIWYGESFISLGECVINGKSYQMWTILYQRKGKCHHFQNCNQFLHCYLIWRILLSFFSSILLLFVNLISYYQALTFTHMIYVEITLSNEYMFICFAPSMFVFLNCFATGWCKVSLIALVLSWLHWLFSSVRFQMSPQIVSLSRCIITSVAFVWLYRASVRFQMSL